MDRSPRGDLTVQAIAAFGLETRTVRWDLTSVLVTGEYPPEEQAPGYAQPYSPPYPVPAKSNGLAITALICGIAGVALFWLAYIVLPFLAAVTAIITGHLALGRIKRDPALGGKGIAITGLVLGYVGAVINLIIGIGFLLLIGYGISQGNSGY